MQLHDYQVGAVNFFLKKPANYQMLDLGLGKTAIALKAIELTGYPAFVFAPMLVAQNTWPEEIKLWTPNLSYTLLHGKHKNTRLKLDRRIYLLNYDGIKWFYHACCNGKFKLRKFFIVIDESSMIKNPSTKRFKLMRKMMPMFSKYVLNLSATPNPNALYELWPQYYMLDSGRRLGKHYGHFMNKYFISTGPPQYKHWLKKGADKAMYQEIHDITYRLRAKDHQKLPPVTYNPIKLRFDKAQQAHYDKLEKQFLLELDGNLIPIDSDAAVIGKCHQYVQGAVYTDPKKYEYRVMHDIKLQALKELIDTSAGQPMLCAIWYKFEYDMICNFLKYKVPIIAGNTTPEQSSYYIQKWNKRQLPLLLAQPQSIKFGLNLQHGGSILLWYTLTWSLESYLQLVGRLVRQGQKNPVFIHHLVIQNTIDEVFMRVLSRKDATQQDMLDAMKEYMVYKHR